MSFFVLSDKYSTGIQSVDNDHRRLVEMIDQLYSAMSKGEAKETIQEIVAGLVEYSNVHFKREEDLMLKFGYPELEQHKILHKSFTERVKGYQEKIDSGVLNISIDVIVFLRDWLISHIQYVDMKFVDSIKRK